MRLIVAYLFDMPGSAPAGAADRVRQGFRCPHRNMSMLAAVDSYPLAQIVSFPRR